MIEKIVLSKNNSQERVGNRLMADVIKELKEEREKSRGKYTPQEKHDLGVEFFKIQVKSFIDEEKVLGMNKLEKLRYYFNLRGEIEDIISKIPSTERFYNGWVEGGDRYMHELYRKWDLHL